MKFLFVHSWQGFCLAEWYLREAVSNQCKVEVEFRSVDIPVAGIPANDTLQRIIFSWGPDLVGFSCHYWSLQSFTGASEWIKRSRPGTIIVLGGPQVNSVNAASSVLENNRSVDYIIRGAGEESVCILIETIKNKKSLNNVPGLSFRERNKILHNNKIHSRRTRDLIFHQGNTELDRQVTRYNEISFETTRGCYSKCAYCYYPADSFKIYGDERILAELSYICSREIRNLRFCDTHFGGTAERAKKILRHLKKVNRNTCFRIYPDPGHIDSEYLQLIRESGAQITSIGVQTTNETALKKINRDPVTKHGKNVRLILNEFPEVPADLIIGLPGDNTAGLENSFKEVLKMGFTSVNIFRLMVFPGTELSENLAEYYNENSLLISRQGQMISSEGFPVNEQTRVSSLVFALEIICWIVRTGTMKLSPAQRAAKFSKLVAGVDPGQLTDLYQMIQPGFTPGNEERIKKTGMIFMKVFKENRI